MQKGPNFRPCLAGIDAGMEEESCVPAYRAAMRSPNTNRAKGYISFADLAGSGVTGEAAPVKNEMCPEADCPRITQIDADLGGEDMGVILVFLQPQSESGKKAQNSTHVCGIGEMR